MAGTHVSRIYAVEDAKIAALTADPTGGSATYGSLIDVPGIKSLGLSFDITNVSLRGDNRELDSDSTLQAVTISFEHAKLSLDALAVMIGGAVTDTGTLTEEVATFDREAADSFSYFKIEAKTPTNGTDNVGGDVHLVIHKCKITDYSLGLAEEDYQTFTGTARGVYRASDDKLFSVIFNETASAIA